MHFALASIAALGLLAQQALACCGGNCYCVKADSFANADCTGGPLANGTASANWANDSDCTDISGAASVTGNNDGCGSSNCDIHWYTSRASCDKDEYGAGGDIQYAAAINSGRCIAKPDGATFMRTVCN